MCQIISPVNDPVEDETYRVGITGVPPLAWKWWITNDLGSDSGSSGSTPAFVEIPIPGGAADETLHFTLTCGGAGQDSEEWVIDAG